MHIIFVRHAQNGRPPLQIVDVVDQTILRRGDFYFVAVWQGAFPEFSRRAQRVNLTKPLPGTGSALRHAHSRQDEFIYMLHGHPVLITDAGETQLYPGMCAGFKAGTGNAHQLLNRSGEEVIYLEVGDRSAGDSASYPDDDLRAALIDGQLKFSHEDGSPY